MHAVLHLKIGPRQLIMSGRKVAIDLNRALKLYGGRGIVALRKILLSAVKILLLSHIGVAGTRSEHQGRRAHDQGTTKKQGTFHCRSPGGRNHAYALQSWLTRQ